MKKVCLTLIVLIISISSLYARKIEIKGTVIDSTNRERLSYCEVLVKSAKDSLISGCITNDKGEFTLTAELKGSETIQIRMFGYNKKKINLPIIDSAAKDYTLGEILLIQETKELKAMEISSLRPFMEKRFDRDVFNMSEGAIASARNIYDLLKKIPGVVVDEDEEIVKYKGNLATIKINNTPAERMYPKLEMIPISDIDKIEVIDPTMRESGSEGAIINIKIKKTLFNGLSGTISSRATINDTAKLNNANAYLNLNYKHKKLLIFNNFGRNISHWEWGSKSHGTRTDEFGTYKDSSASISKSLWSSYTNYFGGEYSFTDKTKIDCQLGGNVYLVDKNESSGFRETFDNKTNELIYGYKYTGNTGLAKTETNLSASVNFNSEIDTLGKELSVNCWISRYKEPDLTKNYTDYFTSPDLNEIQNNINENKYSSINIFYNNPISKNTQWNVNYSNSFQSSRTFLDMLRNDVYQYNLFNDNTSKQFDNNFSSHFGTTIKKLKINFGLSFQNKNASNSRKVYYSSTSDTSIITNRIFNKLTPSGTIKYLINERNEIKLSYNCYYQMPYSVKMFETYIDSTNKHNWYTGNPALETAFNQSIYLGYTYTKEKWNTSIQIFYKTVNKDYTYVSIPIDSATTLSKPMTLMNSQSSGLFYSLYQTFHEIYTLSFNTNWYYKRVDLSRIEPFLILSGLPTSNLIRTSWNYDVSANFEYRKKKNYLSASAYYNSKQISTTGYMMPRFNLNLSYSRNFLKNNLKLALSLNNILFNLNKSASTTNVMGKDSYYQSYSNSSCMTIGFSIRYNFREGDRNTSSKSESGK